MDMPASTTINSIGVLPGSREYDREFRAPWRSKTGAETEDTPSNSDAFYALWRELARRDDGKEHNVQPIEVKMGDEERVMFDPAFRTSGYGVVGDIYTADNPDDKLRIHLLVDDAGEVIFEQLQSEQVA